jgi:hypothetical protein
MELHPHPLVANGSLSDKATYPESVGFCGARGVESCAFALSNVQALDGGFP